MTENVENPSILEHLKLLRNEVKGLGIKMDEQFESVRLRLGSVEGQLACLQREVAGIHADVAIIHGRMDKFDSRLDRIERRLELHNEAG